MLKKASYLLALLCAACVCVGTGLCTAVFGPQVFWSELQRFPIVSIGVTMPIIGAVVCAVSAKIVWVLFKSLRTSAAQ